MKFDEYQELCLRTAKSDLPRDKRIMNWCMGIVGEAGEVVNRVKKLVFHGHEDEREKIAGELGDVLWYLAVLSEDGLFTDMVEYLFVYMNGMSTLPAIDDYEAARRALLISTMASYIADTDMMSSDNAANYARSILTLLTLCNSIAAHFGTTLPDIMTANIAKLKRRYPEGFSEDASINREA